MFQRKSWKHIKEYGLDTVTYIEDPSTCSTMVSIVSDHGKFNFNHGSRKARMNMNNYYDEYMHTCSKDATEFLLDSVDDKIKKQLPY